MRPDFWKGRRVLLTGHTGFKGAWASVILTGFGADLTGLSLPADTVPSLWSAIDGRIPLRSEIVDIRNRDELVSAVRRANPEIVLHMAAQAHVTRAYNNPEDTFASNVAGTVNLLEALRGQKDLQAALIVTSDKVYLNDENGQSFSERSPLGGSDPYSASKAATEIVARSYAQSYFAPGGVRVASARGGNVVGGGDFSSHRLVPDIYRAATDGKPVQLRYPDAERPWQHALDCLSGYLRFVEYLVDDGADDIHALNFGPDPATPAFSVAQVADFVQKRLGNGQLWDRASGDFPPEKQVLRLDSSLALKVLGWRPSLQPAETLEWTAQWYRAFNAGADPLDLTRSQIAEFTALQG